MIISRTHLYYYGKDDWPSNHHRLEFEMQLFKSTPLFRFHTGEQALMALKALVFKDHRSMDLILDCKSPFEALQLGRKVKGFDEDKWKEVRLKASMHVQKARLDSSVELDRLASQMSSRRFVEASPVNLVWGVGLSQDNPAIMNPANYRGANLHGVSWNKVLKERYGTELKRQTSKGVVR